MYMQIGKYGFKLHLRLGLLTDLCWWPSGCYWRMQVVHTAAGRQWHYKTDLQAAHTKQVLLLTNEVTKLLILDCKWVTWFKFINMYQIYKLSFLIILAGKSDFVEDKPFSTFGKWAKNRILFKTNQTTPGSYTTYKIIEAGVQVMACCISKSTFRTNKEVHLLWNTEIQDLKTHLWECGKCETHSPQRESGVTVSRTWIPVRDKKETKTLTNNTEQTLDKINIFLSKLSIVSW